MHVHDGCVSVCVCACACVRACLCVARSVTVVETTYLKTPFQRPATNSLVGRLSGSQTFCYCCQYHVKENMKQISSF